MKLYGGIDLHSNNCVFAICNVDGEVVARRKLPNEFDVILSYLAQFKKQLVELVVESTFNWRYSLKHP